MKCTLVLVASILVFASSTAKASASPTLASDPTCQSTGYLCVRLSSLPGGSIAEAIARAPFKANAKRPAEEEVVNLKVGGSYQNMASLWTVLGSWEEPEHVDNLVYGITTPAEARTYAVQRGKPFLAFTRRAVTPSFPYPDAVLVVPGQGKPSYEELEARLTRMATTVPKIECAKDELYNPRTEMCIKETASVSALAVNPDAGAAICQKSFDWRWDFNAHQCRRQVVVGTMSASSRRGSQGNTAALWLLGIAVVVVGMGRIHRAELRAIKDATLARIHAFKDELAMVRAELAAARTNHDQVVGRTTVELSAVRAELASTRLVHAAELKRLREAHSREMAKQFEQVAVVNRSLDAAYQNVKDAERARDAMESALRGLRDDRTARLGVLGISSFHPNGDILADLTEQFQLLDVERDAVQEACVQLAKMIDPAFVRFMLTSGDSLIYGLEHPWCSKDSRRGKPARLARKEAVPLLRSQLEHLIRQATQTPKTLEPAAATA